jgi:hypothetical protein
MSHQYPEYVMRCEIINNKFLSVEFENKKSLKKDFKQVNCLIPLEHLSMKYEQYSVILGSHGQFYFSLEAEQYEYGKAQEWYAEILNKLKTV